MSQEKLAETSDLHTNHISFLERGLREPSLAVVYQLANGLRMDVSEFIKTFEVYRTEKKQHTIVCCLKIKFIFRLNLKGMVALIYFKTVII
ncbi:helix-turn-helix domain-containing protein [bacterium]|nr:helix-turn-helix domain-containing protein [bacterium]